MGGGVDVLVEGDAQRMRGLAVLMGWAGEGFVQTLRYELKGDLGLECETGVGDVKLMCGCGKGVEDPKLTRPLHVI
jgi:hypothetical protein